MEFYLKDLSRLVTKSLRAFLSFSLCSRSSASAFFSDSVEHFNLISLSSEDEFQIADIPLSFSFSHMSEALQWHFSRCSETIWSIFLPPSFFVNSTWAKQLLSALPDIESAVGPELQPEIARIVKRKSGNGFMCLCFKKLLVVKGDLLF